MKTVCHAALLSEAAALGDHLVNRSGEQEGLLGQIVHVAAQNRLEALDGLFQRHILALHAGEVFGNMEGLGQEALDPAGTGNGRAVLGAELVHTQHRNDILQLTVLFEHLLDGTRRLIVLLSEYVGLQDPRGALQRVHRGIDAELRDGAGQHRCRR